MNAPYVGGSASPPSTVFLYERSQTETDRESGTGQVRLITGTSEHMSGKLETIEVKLPRLH